MYKRLTDACDYERGTDTDPIVGLENIAGFEIAKEPLRNLFGSFSGNDPILSEPMSPLRYCVLTEKSDIIGLLMRSGKYSAQDVDGLKHLAQTHNLYRSLAAIQWYSRFIPPVSLEVLSARSVKQTIVAHSAGRQLSDCVAQLSIPQSLRQLLLADI